MTGIEEKRVYGRRRGGTVAYVASDLGLARVDVAGARIGRFTLVRREPVCDVAGREGRLAVASEDVLVSDATDDPQVSETDFGPAGAVGIDGDRVIAAGPDGVGALEDTWRGLGDAGDVLAIDGDLIAGADVFRVAGGDLRSLSVDTARDVAAPGPYAATDDGLVRLDDDGSVTVREGAHQAVAAAGDRAHAVAGGTLYERSGGTGAWTACDLPVAERVVDVAYGEAVYALTADGTMFAGADRTPDGRGGWRSRALGLTGARAIAVA